MQESDNRPFERIQPHRQILRDIRQMQENLDELEEQVRTAEWIELEGRGVFEEERCERLCDGVERSMPHIKEDIQELPDPYREDS